MWYAFDTLKNDQNDGYGVRASVKVAKNTKMVDFFFEPFVRYWKIKESEWTQFSSQDGSVVWYTDSSFQHPLYGYEPKNQTIEYGVKLGLRY